MLQVSGEHLFGIAMTIGRQFADGSRDIRGTTVEVHETVPRDVAHLHLRLPNGSVDRKREEPFRPRPNLRGMQCAGPRESCVERESRYAGEGGAVRVALRAEWLRSPPDHSRLGPR